MPVNPFKTNEESSFESGVPATKPVKTVTGQAQQQAKAFTDDFLEQLYGPSSPQKGKTNDPQNANLASGQVVQPPPQKKAPYIMGGTANVGDHAKYAAMQKILETGDSKKANKTMYHMQHYFDANIGTLEDNAAKARRVEEQKKQQRLQQEEEDKQKKNQEEEQKNAEIPRANAKGRNRMMMPGGKKPKTPMAVQMGQMKTETFRGSSG